MGIDSYTVVFARLLLSAGSLGDRLGARRVLDAGLGLFTAASLACALAPSLPVLVGARAAQGLGAALLVPSSLALLRAAYRDPAERARAVGAWGAVAGIGAASGPVLGGLLVALARWRAVFIVNVPVGLIGFVPALVAFVAVERRGREPMLPLSLFGNRTFSGASFVGLAINLGFYGQLFAMSLYFQRVRGFSALQTGLALLPEGVFVAVASLLSGRVTSKTGPRLPMLASLGCGAAGFAGLIAAGRSTSYPLLVPALVAAGFGMAFTMPAATAATIESAPAERVGIASGVLNAARQAGGAIGVALLGTLLASTSFVSGLHAAMSVSAGSFLAGAAVTAAAVDRHRGCTRPSRRASPLSRTSGHESSWM